MTDKDLLGKFLLATLTKEELQQLPLDPPPTDSHWWMVGGFVEGQTYPLGLWIRPTIVQDGSGARIRNLPEKDLLLLPWDFIRRAILFEQQPEQIGPVGFKPR